LNIAHLNQPFLCKAVHATDVLRPGPVG
jgi:hypothetical protein